MSDPKNILVAVAWPYANGEQHLGHISGAYLPPDIFARYHRMAGNDVLMVSGSDAHGTPITVRAENEGVEPADIVNRFHPIFQDVWARLGVTFDMFTTTMTDNHRDVVHDMFNDLRTKGLIESKISEQYYDTEKERFLPDRYVEGTCPNCDYPDARGDQCDKCGRTLDPTDLKNVRSKLSGSEPTLRETEHYYIMLTKLQEEVASWLETREDWRPHVINWAKGFLKEGLQDRAITRDLTWGVPIPAEHDTIGEGKRIYVWFEAVIGYLSASIEWAKTADKNPAGDASAWERWWKNPDAESYYFIGKDNVPFHAVFWPAYLLGYGDLNLPTNVPANQYVTFKGEKASKSRGVGKTVGDYLDEFEPDALRYALATTFPEQNDTELTEDDMVRRINDELVAAWGNLVNRVLAMTHKYFDGVVPDAGELDGTDSALLDFVDQSLVREAELLERVELRAALKEAMAAAQEANAYLNEREPWKTAKVDMDRTATTMHVVLQAINGIKTGFAPYLPHTCAELDRMLGGEGVNVGAVGQQGSGFVRESLAAGTKLGETVPLFAKIEIEANE